MFLKERRVDSGYVFEAKEVETALVGMRALLRTQPLGPVDI